MKSRAGQRQREEKRVRRTKMQMREKVGKSRNTVFPIICGSGRSKSRLAKAAGAETPGQMRDETLHVVVARSRFRRQNVQNTPCSDHFWEKCTPLWREAHFEVKMYKTPHVRATFGGSDVVSRGRRKGLCTLSKMSKTWGFCRISKNHGKRGAFEEDLQRCIFRGRSSTKDMFLRDVRKSGRWFPKGVSFWSIRSVGLQRWFCVTGAALRMTWHQFFVAGLEKLQNALVRGCQLCTQLSIFEGSLAELLCFRSCQVENWRSLAELLRFGCCQVQKMQTSRRIISFWTLLYSNIKEVSQNFFVFDLADR